MGSRKQAFEIGVICILFLVLAGYAEATNQKLDEQNRIARGQPGDGSTAVDLTLDAAGILEDYNYTLKVEEMPMTEEDVKACFAAAKQEIDESFYTDGDTADCVTHAVCMKESYSNQLVHAEWELENYHAVDVDGTILEDAVPREGTLVQATADLSCKGCRESYSFGFMVYPRAKSPEEELIVHVGDAIDEEQAKEGNDYLTLPDEVDGYALQWAQAKEHLVIKVFLFELVILVLLHFVRLERNKEKEKKRKEEMMLDYAEVVNKLLILLGSGMSLKQAWNRIAARYLDKRDKRKGSERWIYEEMAITNYEIQDGESERIAYQRFGERTGVGVYYRLVRILVQNLQTGSRGLCQLLEQEAESALEDRKALAKKMGEEAGTKMLLPLMMMLGIVIAIIMVPAILSFNL